MNIGLMAKDKEIICANFIRINVNLNVNEIIAIIVHLKYYS